MPIGKDLTRLAHKENTQRDSSGDGVFTLTHFAHKENTQRITRALLIYLTQRQSLKGIGHEMDQNLVDMHSRWSRPKKGQCCGYGMFISDSGSEFFQPGSRVKKIPDPGSGSKSLNIFNPKNISKLSEIWPGCSSSRIRIPDWNKGFKLNSFFLYERWWILQQLAAFVWRKLKSKFLLVSNKTLIAKILPETLLKILFCFFYEQKNFSAN